MKIAVIGSGGREHALAWALARHRPASDVFVLPGNGGTANSAPIDTGDADGIRRFCKEKEVGLVIVGPEAPLAAGLVDALRADGIAAFGPTQAAARLESSKLFAKAFMRRHGVATPDSWAFGPGEEPAKVIEALAGDLVLKYDGLAAGKGVWVCSSVEEATRAVAELRTRHGGQAPFLIEQRLRGDELSIIGFTDGGAIRLLPPSQDHKALLDGDRGPNTGGMGAFSPVPQATPTLMERIRRKVIEPTLAGLEADQLDFRGVLYFGLMLTAEGPRCLEYNVRLGDPEAEVLLPLLENDPAELALACLDRKLERVPIQVSAGAAVSVVLAAGGYPDKPETGREILGLDRLSEGTLAFHAGTRREGGKVLTSGGRVLNVVTRGATLDEAIAKAYGEVEKVRFEGMQFRRDIGRRTWRTGSA